MFLNHLEERNKEHFLKLCVYAALSNEVFAKEEKEMLSAYCREMNVPVHVPETKEPLENILAEIAENASETEKNIIVLEILGLLKSDNIYDERESAFMENLVNGIEAKQKIVSNLVGLLDIYTTVCKTLYDTVME